MDISQYAVTSGDLEFLKRKLDNSEIVNVVGTATGTGVIVSYTPASGKTFYLVAASLVTQLNDLNADCLVIAQVRNDTTVKDYMLCNNETKASGSGVGGASGGQKTKSVIMDMLIGNGAKSYDINISTFSNGDGATACGTLFGWIEDT